MKRILLHFAILILLLTCSSCSHKSSVKAILHRADSLLNYNLPDSSLSVIGAIPIEQLKSPSEKAEFILLYERILESNNLPLIGEEDLIAAAEYFRKEEDLANEFLSRFYLARIYEIEGNSYDAMTQYVEAEGLYLAMAKAGVKVQDSVNDLLSSTIARIYIYKGDIYHSKFNFNGALKMYNKALEYHNATASSAQSSEQTLTKMKTLGKIAQAYEALEEYEKALEAYSSALVIAQNRGARKDIILYGSSIAGVKFAMGELSGRVLEDLYELYRLYGNSTPPHDNYILLSCLYLDCGQIKKAKEFALNYISQRGKITDLEEAGWASLMASIAKTEGNYKEALDYIERYNFIMSQISEQEKNNSVQEVEQLYYNRQLKIENDNIRRHNRSALIIYTLLVVILIGGMVWGYFTWRRKIEEKNRQIEEYLVAAQDAESSKITLLDELDVQKEKEKRLKELLENRFAEIRELAGTYYEFGYSKKLQKKVEQLLSFQSFGQDMFEVIENVVNAKNNGVIEKIRAEYPSITEDNIKLLNLIYAGFSPQEISVIINDTPQNIYVRKSRLKRKLAPLVEQESEMAFK